MNIIGFFYHLRIIISKTTKKGVISSKTYASRIFQDPRHISTDRSRQLSLKDAPEICGSKVPVKDAVATRSLSRLVVEPTHLKDISQIGSFPQFSGWVAGTTSFTVESKPCLVGSF